MQYEDTNKDPQPSQSRSNQQFSLRKGSRSKKEVSEKEAVKKASGDPPKDFKIQFATNFKTLMISTKHSTRKGNNRKKKRNNGKLSEKHSSKLRNSDKNSVAHFKGCDTLSLNVKQRIHNPKDHNMIYKSGIQSTKGIYSFWGLLDIFYRLK